MQKKRDKKFVVHLFLISAVIFLALSFMSAGCVIEFTHWKPGPGPHYCAIKQLDAPEGSDVIGCIATGNEADCLAYEKYGDNGGHYWRPGDPADDPECINCMGIYQSNDETWQTFFLLEGQQQCGPTDSKYKDKSYFCDAGVVIETDCAEDEICDPVIGECKTRWTQPVGSQFVWEDGRYGRNVVYMYDIFTGQETQITWNTSMGNGQRRPDINQGRIVYVDSRKIGSGYFDKIFMNDTSTGEEIQITFPASSSAAADNPQIYGNKIIYTNATGLNLYNLIDGTHKLIARGGSAGRIYKNEVVYLKTTSWIIYINDWPMSYSARDVFFYNITSGATKQITNNSIFNVTRDEYYPAVYKDKITYMDGRGIFVYDLTIDQEIQIKVDTSAWTLGGHNNLDIYGDKIVWVGGDHKLYIKDISTGEEKTIITVTSNPTYPRVVGNTVVYNEFTSGKIYTYDIATDIETLTPSASTLSKYLYAIDK